MNVRWKDMTILVFADNNTVPTEVMTNCFVLWRIITGLFITSSQLLTAMAILSEGFSTHWSNPNANNKLS